jgi:hypothetical protein
MPTGACYAAYSRYVGNLIDGLAALEFDGPGLPGKRRIHPHKHRYQGSGTGTRKFVGIIEDYVGTTYDPETVRVMGLAFDAVLHELHDSGQPAVVREVIAKRIVELASIGERDPQHLCRTVLSELGLPSAGRN